MDEVKMFWDNVDYYRKILGLTWSDVVNGDVTASKNGTRVPNLKRMAKIAKRLDLPLEALVSDDHEITLDVAYDLVESDLGLKKDDLSKASRILRAVYD